MRFYGDDILTHQGLVSYHQSKPHLFTIYTDQLIHLLEVSRVFFVSYYVFFHATSLVLLSRVLKLTSYTLYYVFVFFNYILVL